MREHYNIRQFYEQKSLYFFFGQCKVFCFYKNSIDSLIISHTRSFYFILTLLILAGLEQLSSQCSLLIFFFICTREKKKKITIMYHLHWRKVAVKNTTENCCLIIAMQCLCQYLFIRTIYYCWDIFFFKSNNSSFKHCPEEYRK